MANCLPFNSIEHDRVYKAEDWAWYFGTFISNGIFPKPSDGLQVIAYNGMEVKVNAGYAFINGYAYRNPASVSVKLNMAEGALNRIDRVVIRWDLTQRDIYIAVLKGGPSAKPVATNLTRTTEIWELAIADIYIGKGVTKIQTANITDQRFNSSLCGIVTGTVKEIDASVLTKQFTDFFKVYSEAVINDYNSYKQKMQTYLDELEVIYGKQIREEIEKMYDQFNILADKLTQRELKGKEEIEKIRAEFDELVEILGGVENGELLLELKNLLETMYMWATDMDIDAIIDGSYVDTDENGGIFDTATDEDIDAIIDGTFIEDEEENDDTDEITEDEIQKLIDNDFKEI